MIYSIGEVAKMVRVSIESLRSWEKQGLIPKPDRRPTGLREYSEEDVKAIRDFVSKRFMQNRDRRVEQETQK